MAKENSSNYTIMNHGLGVFTRILLAMDGTLTKCLESIFMEKVVLAIKEQELVNSCEFSEELMLGNDDSILRREVILKGEQSDMSLLHAVSYILLDRIGSEFKKRLLEGEITIGQIWNKQRAELFKEFLYFAREPNSLGGNTFPGFDTLNVRRYRVFYQKMPVFLITEQFPDYDLKEYMAKRHGSEHLFGSLTDGFIQGALSENGED